MTESTNIHGHFTLTLTRADGSVEMREKDNMILAGGYDFLCDAVGAASRPSAMSHTAVGTGTAAAALSQTALVSELGRKAAAYAHTQGTKELTLTTTFGAGEATGAITEAGIVNGASGGTFLDRVTFDVINKGAQDELTTRFVFTLS